MKTSEQLNEIFAALANAAAEFPKIERTCTAKVYPKKEGAQPYSYDYADLDDVLSAVRGPLAKNGVILSHDAKLIRDPLCLEVTARLEHASGQFKESEPLPMPLEGTMSLAQQIGSAYTYGRRYTSQAILGISTEADDDGHGAGDQQVDTGRKKSEPKPLCPECGSNKFVYEDKNKGGFFCWKKPSEGKHGCGHNWLPADEQPPPGPPKTNGKAAEVAAEHGLKTAADLAATQKATFDRAMAAIQKAVRERDCEKLKRISAAASKDAKEGNLSREQDTNIVNELAMAEKKIEAMEKEPVGAT